MAGAADINKNKLSSLHQENQQPFPWASQGQHKSGFRVIKQLDCALNLSSLRDISNKIHMD